VLEPALHLTGNGHCESRESVQEVRCAVEGIDDPNGIAISRAAALLSQEGVAGVVLPNELDDLSLGRMIDFADEVIAPLRCDRQGFEAVEATDDDFAGGTGGPDGDIEKRMHGD
jgi:hypothetical protein